MEKNNPEIARKFDELLVFLGAISKGGLLEIAPHSRSDLDEDGLNNYYYEREGRCTRDWNFSPQHVAAIVLPDDYVERFFKDRGSRKLSLRDETPVIPFSMIHGL